MFQHYAAFKHMTVERNVAFGLEIRRRPKAQVKARVHELLELVGLDAVAAVVGELGLTATRVERLIGDAAALERGLTNETSAADLARTMHHLVAGPGLSGDSRELAVAALHAQTIPIIGSVLRDGVRWGSKSGWVDGYRHDVAYVEDPAVGGLRVLAVMTAGLAEEEADARIAALVRELIPEAAQPSGADENLG